MKMQEKLKELDELESIGMRNRAEDAEGRGDALAGSWLRALDARRKALWAVQEETLAKGRPSPEARERLTEITRKIEGLADQFRERKIRIQRPQTFRVGALR